MNITLNPQRLFKHKVTPNNNANILANRLKPQIKSDVFIPSKKNTDFKALTFNGGQVSKFTERSITSPMVVENQVTQYINADKKSEKQAIKEWGLKTIDSTSLPNYLIYLDNTRNKFRELAKNNDIKSYTHTPQQEFAGYVVGYFLAQTYHCQDHDITDDKFITTESVRIENQEDFEGLVRNKYQRRGTMVDKIDEQKFQYDYEHFIKPGYKDYHIFQQEKTAHFYTNDPPPSVMPSGECAW